MLAASSAVLGSVSIRRFAPVSPSSAQISCLYRWATAFLNMLSLVVFAKVNWAFRENNRSIHRIDSLTVTGKWRLAVSQLTVKLFLCG